MKIPLHTPIIFALLTAISLVFSGCGSTPKKVAYQTLASVGATVDVSMKAAATAKVQGKISDADWATIAEKHQQFIKAYRVACDVAAFDITKLASDQLIQTVVDLTNFITSLGVKL